MKKEKIVVDECTKQMGRQDRINYQLDNNEVANYLAGHLPNN